MQPTNKQITNPTEEIHDLEVRMKVFHGQIAALRTDENNPVSIEGAIQKHVERMLWHQGQIDILNHRANHIPEMISELQKQLRVMKKRLTHLRNRHQITKLLKLHAEMQQLSTEAYFTDEEKSDADQSDVS
jgi:uncharacterized coiled-coil DUF342 family protein